MTRWTQEPSVPHPPQDLGYHPQHQYDYDYDYESESEYGYEYERPSRADRRRGESDRRRRRRRRLLVPLVVLLVIGGLGAGALYGGQSVLARFATTPDFEGQGSGSVLIRVQPGDTATDIAATLAAKGVVKSEKAFRNAAVDDPRSLDIQPGTYRLRKEMSGASALGLLLDPAARVMSRLTVPEGLTVAATLKLIADKTEVPLADLKAAAEDTDALGLPGYAKGRLEGFLFPETYDLQPGTSAEEMLRAMVEMFKEKVDASGLSGRAADVGLDPYELIVVASLVERETQRVEERSKVARVIYNRLEQDYYLGVDAAVLYGLGRSGGPLTAADLAKRTPYNNRLVKGLPPTPIANPGLASVQGAVEPAPGPWLYYVLDDDRSGRHVFTADPEEFNAAKARCVAAGLC